MSSNSAAEFVTGDQLSFSTSNSVVGTLKANTNILTFMLETPNVSNVTSAATSTDSSNIIVDANTFIIAANTNILVLVSNNSQSSTQEASRTTLVSSNNGSYSIGNNVNILTVEVNRPISTLDRSGQIEVKQVWIG